MIIDGTKSRSRDRLAARSGLAVQWISSLLGLRGCPKSLDVIYPGAQRASSAAQKGPKNLPRPCESSP